MLIRCTVIFLHVQFAQCGCSIYYCSVLINVRVFFFNRWTFKQIYEKDLVYRGFKVLYHMSL